MTWVEWSFLVAVAAVAGGYALGRRVGLGEGRAEGLASAPLALRARALEAGRCPICGHAAQAPTDQAQAEPPGAAPTPPTATE